MGFGMILACWRSFFERGRSRSVTVGQSLVGNRNSDTPMDSTFALISVEMSCDHFYGLQSCTLETFLAFHHIFPRSSTLEDSLVQITDIWHLWIQLSFPASFSESESRIRFTVSQERPRTPTGSKRFRNIWPFANALGLNDTILLFVHGSGTDWCGVELSANQNRHLL